MPSIPELQKMTSICQSRGNANLSAKELELSTREQERLKYLFHTPFSKIPSKITKIPNNGGCDVFDGERFKEPNF